MSIERATPADWRSVSATLAGAFDGDPVWRWMLRHREAAGRQRALERFFGLETRYVALGHGESLRDGDRGAVLALPPGHWRTPLSVQTRYAPQYARVFGRRLGHAAGLLAALERRHLRRPHVFVAYIGVAPHAQGQGIGRALLERVAERCDAHGLPGYIEASSPDSARLYARVGFVTQEVVRPLGAPPIELMTREPRSRIGRTT